MQIKPLNIHPFSREFVYGFEVKPLIQPTNSDLEYVKHVMRYHYRSSDESYHVEDLYGSYLWYVISEMTDKHVDDVPLSFFSFQMAICAILSRSRDEGRLATFWFETKLYIER